MKEKKEQKPDQVVYNEETEKYEAGLLPYGANASAPKITPSDVTHWKNGNLSKVNHQIKTEYESLKEAYENLMKRYEYNKLVYSAQFSFEPIVGEIYHLYESPKKGIFLSIIHPDECDFDHKGSFKLDEDKMWNNVDKNDI